MPRTGVPSTRAFIPNQGLYPVFFAHWKAQDSSIRHMGPMAQDFHAAFGVGADEHYINTVDADGVALAAIQGLYQLLEDKEREIAHLREAAIRVTALERTLEALQVKLGLK